jgi:hypothetical protein
VLVAVPVAGACGVTLSSSGSAHAPLSTATAAAAAAVGVVVLVISEQSRREVLGVERGEISRIKPVAVGRRGGEVGWLVDWSAGRQAGHALIGLRRLGKIGKVVSVFE